MQQGQGSKTTVQTGSFCVMRNKGGFPGGRVVKNPSANARDEGDAGLIPSLGKSSRGGNGNPLQYSCLENPMDREAWRAIHGVAESGTTECTYTHTAPQMILMHEKGGSHWSRTAFITQGFF